VNDHYGKDELFGLILSREGDLILLVADEGMVSHDFDFGESWKGGVLDYYHYYGFLLFFTRRPFRPRSREKGYQCTRLYAIYVSHVCLLLASPS